MRTLGKAHGLFSLENSNKHIGSYISKHDVCEILDVSQDALINLNFINVDGIPAIDEAVLHKSLEIIPGFKKLNRASLDEYILKAIIKRIYPEAFIEQQVKIGRYIMDLRVTHRDKTVFIEFDGPSHFAISRYGAPKDIWKKKNAVQDIGGIEVIKWPFWIQRCEKNVRAIFEPNTKGYGALWSTNCLFGDFYFEDSADIILKLNSSFGIEAKDIHTFYSPGSDFREIPEHPIIKKILNGKEKLSRLIPKGAEFPIDWIPAQLRAHAFNNKL